ncbi:DUF1702 family protein [Actinomadura livida]|uniref:DUF1702 family protein n=1 Tax=Actinomadura livida TaxID=79909 RepID=A0A7W7I8K3_9ACTN|nr:MULTISPECIES: DUF1702 family protein [Actinomadura]MBB4772425.1 hypothetical protein [Actinomadura catellatispora]GGU23038.1 hypothetical protein GCM10010208_55060 [Actinomadura livida]
MAWRKPTADKVMGMAKEGYSMPTALGSIRRLIMTPALADVTAAKRGFPVRESEITRHLEAIPQSVICGFEWGIDARGLWEVERRLSQIQPELRGFAYEGATMAFTIVDTMGRRGHRTRELLEGPGSPHIFLAYIGIGFAMARLPRPLWKKVLPDLHGSPYHPTMSWLAVDGYGFDRAYFDTERWVDRQHRPKPYPWLGSPDYFNRAVDQGIGRCLWFIHGAQAADVAARIEKFAPERRPDLWSGVGLAATFAGGADAAGLETLRRLAGAHAADLAQGSVFAAKARTYAGHVPEYGAAATLALTGLSPEAATTLADDSAVPETAGGADLPAYEMWRTNVRRHFLSVVENRTA